MRLGAWVSAQRGWVLGRLLAAALLFGAALLPSVALAQEPETCEFEDDDDGTESPDTEGCLSQEGDNLSGNNDDFNGGGGDGVGGSNVIGGAGTGRTRIRADNTSEFSDAKGGDTESDSTTEIDNGPELTVERGNTTIVAEATGVSSVNQVAAPTVSITLEQVAEATGLSTFSNTASASTALTGANVLGQSVVSPTFGSTGAGPVTQTLNQTASSTVSNTFAPVINTTSTNIAVITAAAPVTQLGTAVSNPTAIATPGPGVSAAAAASGSAVVAQSATPTFTFGTSQTTSQTAPSFSNAASVRTSLNALNSVTGAPLGPVVQTILQNASSPSATLDALNIIVAAGPGVAPVTQVIVQNADGSLTNVFTPTMTSANSSTLTVSGSSPVVQSANAVSNPTSTVGP